MKFQKKNKYSAPVIALALFTMAIVSCSKDDNQTNPLNGSISYGNYVKVGNGKARSFIVKNTDGSAKEIGFKFTEEAMTGLPEHDAFFKLPMPADNKTLVDHISFDYANHGHGPDGVYNIPHFDMHFYMLTEKEIDAITLEDPKIDIVPPAQYIPKNYVAGANEPKMGKHWADSTAHEFHGQLFTSTFIYGSYNGKFHFFEPMVTLDYLKTKPNVTLGVVQQPKVQRTGLYPQKYSINWEKDIKEYSVSLNSLQLQNQQ